MAKFIDLTGQRFGRLIVLKRAEDYIQPNGTHRVRWLCKCDCDGKEIIVRGTHLRNKHTQSCGCLQKEEVAKIGKLTKKYNIYDLSSEYGVGYTDKGEEFWFDLEDYDKIKNYCWYFNSTGYVVTHDFNNNFKTVPIHRLIMGLTDSSLHVDHKHGILSRYDNRKSNIRVATPSQNNMNKGLRRNNTSGLTGVVWYDNIQKWVARISVDNNNIFLGAFYDFEDAVKARKQAEEQYFGEFSYDNSFTL